MELYATGEVPAWTLADRLQKARRHAHLSQHELAAEIGISRASVVNYETGRTSPSRPVLLSWALACKVDLEWLTGPPTTRGDIVSHDPKVRKRGRSTPLHGLAAAVPTAALALTGMGLA